MFKIVWEHLVKAKARIVVKTRKVMSKGPRSQPIKDLVGQGGETLSSKKIMTAMGRGTLKSLNLWFYTHIKGLLSLLSLLFWVWCSSTHPRKPAHLTVGSKEKRLLTLLQREISSNLASILKLHPLRVPLSSNIATTGEQAFIQGSWKNSYDLSYCMYQPVCRVWEFMLIYLWMCSDRKN